MEDNAVVNARDSNYCGERFRYVRYYNDSVYSLNGIGDNEFRLFRALLFYTDVNTLCIDLSRVRLRMLVIELAFRGIDNWDGNIRRYQRSMRGLLGMKLVLKNGRSVMVNPRVAFPGDFHDYRRALVVWDELFTKSKKI